MLANSGDVTPSTSGGGLGWGSDEKELSIEFFESFL
ncbi:MAG: hypothetical protein RLZZ612_2598 [Pseudomonadota bacterium]|jgi:hypothetical protein